MIHIAFPSGSRSPARSCVLQTRQSQALATRAAGDPLVLGGLGVLLDAVRVAAPERVRGACAVVLPEHAWDLVAHALRAELAHGCPLLSAALRSSPCSPAFIPTISDAICLFDIMVAGRVIYGVTTPSKSLFKRIFKLRSKRATIHVFFYTPAGFSCIVL